MKLRVLFLIHDLGNGGAEKVLVNLVNRLDKEKYSITVMALFDGGSNRELLENHIRYISCFTHTLPGNSHLMKLLSPEVLHKWLIKDNYDIEVAYLEGPSTRIVSGCPNSDSKLFAWIHCNINDRNKLSNSFRSYQEAVRSYSKFDNIVCVSKAIADNFHTVSGITRSIVVAYNTVDSENIISNSEEKLSLNISNETFNLVTVASLKPVKGIERLLKVVKTLKERYKFIHLYIIGDGPLRKSFEKYIIENKLTNEVTMVGFQENPYKYMSKCDLYICSSYSEGFSTAVTEALILGLPVLTTDVAGMKELLGDNNEYGVIVDNSFEGLITGIEAFLKDNFSVEHYRKQAIQRGCSFSAERTVCQIERLFDQYFES